MCLYIYLRAVEKLTTDMTSDFLMIDCNRHDKREIYIFISGLELIFFCNRNNFL